MALPDHRRFDGAQGGTNRPTVFWRSAPRPGTIDIVVAIAMIDVVGLIAILGACGGLYYLSSRIEPHWVAKDGSRFLTVAQDLDEHGLPIGRRRDVRVQMDDESDALLISRRSFLRPDTAVWTVKSKSTARRGRNVYVLRRQTVKLDDVGFIALRVPDKSSVIARLDALLAITGDEATMQRERELYRSEQARQPGATEAFGSPGSPPLAPPTDRD
jgi:hypothetical protein